MKEPGSYFDWESQLKVNPTKANRLKSEKKKVNSIGILKEEFTKILASWKEKNKI